MRGKKARKNNLFYFCAGWNLQWHVIVSFSDKFRFYRSLNITKKNHLKTSQALQWALLWHKSMKGKPLMSVRYGFIFFPQLKMIVLKSFSQFRDSQWGEGILCYSNSATCWPGGGYLQFWNTRSLAMVMHSAECTVPTECCCFPLQVAKESQKWS